MGIHLTKKPSHCKLLVLLLWRIPESASSFEDPVWVFARCTHIPGSVAAAITSIRVPFIQGNPPFCDSMMNSEYFPELYI